jgi:hypothetical protein
MGTTQCVILLTVHPPIVEVILPLKNVNKGQFSIKVVAHKVV